MSVLLLWCLLIVKMELFLLEEEDDYVDIFITQTPKVQEVGNEGNSAKDGQFLGLDRDDFQSPCASIWIFRLKMCLTTQIYVAAANSLTRITLPGSFYQA